MLKLCCCVSLQATIRLDRILLVNFRVWSLMLAFVKPAQKNTNRPNPADPRGSLIFGLVNWVNQVRQFKETNGVKKGIVGRLRVTYPHPAVHRNRLRNTNIITHLLYIFLLFTIYTIHINPSQNNCSGPTKNNTTT